ncbi:hypothetical protein TNCV_1448311 [Trichonephila clavipes]|nr:hypothetical protein TNCV_1448311 [Trichonephila clavipes]
MTRSPFFRGSFRGFISEPDLLTTPESEILDGFSDQGVIQAVKTSISTVTQTDEKITQIICPPLKLLHPIPKTSFSNLTVSSSSTQANLLTPTSSTSAAQPTVILINITTAKSNSLASAESKSTNNLKQNRQNRKMRTTEPKHEIEFKMTPHKPKKSSTHYTSEDEDKIHNDVDESPTQRFSNWRHAP